MLHIGRKAPKGWREEPGAIHLGRGLWAMWIVRVYPVGAEGGRAGLVGAPSPPPGGVLGASTVI